MLSSLSKVDSTRCQHKIFSKPITIVNTALSVVNCLNLPQGDILTRTEKHFEELRAPGWAAVHGVAKRWTRMSNFTSLPLLPGSSPSSTQGCPQDEWRQRDKTVRQTLGAKPEVYLCIPPLYPPQHLLGRSAYRLHKSQLKTLQQLDLQQKQDVIHILLTYKSLFII